jgi:hypothetical protein
MPQHNTLLWPFLRKILLTLFLFTEFKLELDHVKLRQLVEGHPDSTLSQ